MTRRKQTKKELDELRYEMARRTNNPYGIRELLNEIETGNLAAIYKREHDALDATDEKLEQLHIKGTALQIKQLEEARLRFQMRVDIIDTAAKSALNSPERTWFDSKLNTVTLTVIAIAIVIVSILDL